MRRQELFCHACARYVRFDVPEVNGRLVVRCPNCEHEHYRVVHDGEITEERWGSANRAPIIYASNTYTSSTSIMVTYQTAGSQSTFLRDSWLSSSSTTTGTR